MASNSLDDAKEITLSPEVRRIRNSIIKKFADEPLDIMAKFVKEVVDNEEDTVKRLGAMAARVEILRMRIAQISEEERPSVLEPNVEEVVEEEHTLEDAGNEIVITNPNLSDWVRLRIIENSEINGVRFPKGVVIDVSQEDGDRLLEAGKASYVNEDEINDVKSEVRTRKETDAQSETQLVEGSEIIQADDDEKDNKDKISEKTGAENIEKTASIQEKSEVVSDIIKKEETDGDNEEKEPSEEATENIDGIDASNTDKIEPASDKLKEEEPIIDTDKKLENSAFKSNPSDIVTSDEVVSENNKKSKPVAKTKKTKLKSSQNETRDEKNIEGSSDSNAEDLLAGFDLETDQKN